MIGRLGFYKYTDLTPLWDRELKLIKYDTSTQEDIDRLIDYSKKLVKSDYVLTFNRGTSALTYGLRELKLVNKKIQTCPMLCSAVNIAIKENHSIPLYADTDENEDIIKLSKSDAFVHANLGGRVKNYGKIIDYCKDNRILLIDDAAQSFGGKHKNKICGSFGEFGITSFNIGKLLKGINGGLLFTNNEKLTENYSYVPENTKKHRWAKRYYYNTYHRKKFRPFFYILEKSGIIKDYFKIEKMSTMQAKIALEQLKKMNSIIKKRQENANYYKTFLKQEDYKIMDNCDSNIYMKFSILLNNEKDLTPLKRHLQYNRIETERQNYNGPESLTAYKVSRRILNLPVNHEMNRTLVRYISEIIDDYFKKIK